jgi:hypothetical protein
MSSYVQSILSNYNILNYKEDFLLYHCSRNEIIRAPFEGECIKINKDTCVISNDNVKLYIYHISDITEGHVNVGDIIGYPIVSLFKNDKIAYIGLKEEQIKKPRRKSNKKKK